MPSLQHMFSRAEPLSGSHWTSLYRMLDLPNQKTVEQDSRNEEMGQNLGLLVSSHLAGGSAPWPSRTMPIFPQGHSKIWQQPARGISIGNPSHLPIKVINLGSYIYIYYTYMYISLDIQSCRASTFVVLCSPQPMCESQLTTLNLSNSVNHPPPAVPHGRLQFFFIVLKTQWIWIFCTKPRIRHPSPSGSDSFPMFPLFGDLFPSGTAMEIQQKSNQTTSHPLGPQHWHFHITEGASFAGRSHHLLHPKRFVAKWSILQGKTWETWKFYWRNVKKCFLSRSGT